MTEHFPDTYNEITRSIYTSMLQEEDYLKDTPLNHDTPTIRNNEKEILPRNITIIQQETQNPQKQTKKRTTNKPISVTQAPTPEISTPTPINPTSTNIQQCTLDTTSTAPDTSNPKLQPSTTTKNQQPTTTATSNTTTTLQIQRMR